MMPIHPHSPRPFASAAILLVAVSFLTSVGFAQAPAEPILAVSVDHAILCPTDGEPASTSISATPLNFPGGASLVFDWKQVQDEMAPASTKIAGKQVHFSNPHEPSIVATFAAPGLYELQVTATDSQHHSSASRNTWINVWSPRPALTPGGVPDPLTVIPGMAPPRVRNVAPEPGPFIHPRLLCSPSDWKDVHSRAVEGKSKIAAFGWKTLANNFKQGVDPGSPNGKFLAQIEAFADAGFTGAPPDLLMGGHDPNATNGILSGLFSNLAQASFTQWLKLGPPAADNPPDARELALARKLAKQVAAISRFLLDNSWDRKTGTFRKDAVGYIRNLESPGEPCPDSYSQLAIAYDFIAPWMTPDQLRDTRNILIAIGRGRRGPGLDPNHSNPNNRGVERGFEQNGTFGVWGEPMIWTSLVVSGEESGADPAVIKTFLNPPKPANYATSRTTSAYDFVRPVDFDGGGPLRVSRPYPSTITWPHALKCDVNLLQKEIWTYQDGMISPWGFTLERIAYFGYMTNETWPAAYTFARFGGFNQFVGCYFYQTVNNIIYTIYPSGGPDRSLSFSSNVAMYEHHSGGGDYRQQHILLLKHMYPEDPIVDYAYAAEAPYLEKRAFNPIHTCIFGVDPSIKDLAGALEPAAASQKLPLTKLDPQLGIAVMRSGWKDDDLMLYLDGGHPLWGHMNAEHGSFALLALGRHWSVPSGYHKVLANFQSLIQVQNPAWSACPYTQGYMTETPCFTPEVPGCDYHGGFPTPSAHLIEVREAPDQRWSIASTDITTCYNYTCGNPAVKPVQFDVRNSMYPGLLDFLNHIDPEYGRWGKVSFFPVPDSCKIERAIRTVLFVRGKYPYCLIVDDFRKSEAPANYRWTMNDKTKLRDEGWLPDAGQPDSFCVQLAPGATSTDAILFHQRDKESQPGQTGLPRLLVRNVSENDNTHQPAVRMVQMTFKLPEEKYSREDTNALIIERDQVVDPEFKVLLFPFRTGGKLPLTSWNESKTALKIALPDGTTDTIQFDHSNLDHRTRLVLK